MKGSEETTFSNDSLMPTVSSCPPLRTVGRSRTDPGKGDEPCHSDPVKSTKASLECDLKRVTLESAESGMPTLNDIIGLTPYQQKLLTQSWPNIYSNGPNGAFASNIYYNLCNRNAKAKALMQKADTAAVFAQSDVDCSKMHTRLTLELIDNVVKNLDQSPDRFIDYLMELKRVTLESAESGMPTLNDIIGLTPYQQKLLTQSWPNIYSNGPNGAFASNIYYNLCNRNAKAKALMQKADTAAVFAQSDVDCSKMHTRLTLELIDNVVKNLDQSPDRFIDYLMEVGQCHRHLKAEGLSQAAWDDLG
uniref:Globin family profile domain-containing protein n=1 Tax=Ascaris lumbricoides TaxID=6252 RepID=A0A9J2QCH0_ASCLU